MLELSHFSSGFTGGKLTVINLPRMRRRVTVVVLSVRLCVTANLGIHTLWRQVMGTSGIIGVWRSLTKSFFSKNASFKSYGVIYSPRVALASFQVS